MSYDINTLPVVSTELCSLEWIWGLDISIVACDVGMLDILLTLSPDT